MAKVAHVEEPQMTMCQALEKLATRPGWMKLTEHEKLVFEKVRLSDARSRKAGFAFGGKLNLKQMAW